MNEENHIEIDDIILNHYELGIIRRFDFESKLQRMSTIVKNIPETNFLCFCKGSPEKISELCVPDVRMIKYSSLYLEAKFEEFFLMNSLCSHNIRFIAFKNTPLARETCRHDGYCTVMQDGFNSRNGIGHRPCGGDLFIS